MTSEASRSRQLTRTRSSCAAYVARRKAVGGCIVCSTGTAAPDRAYCQPCIDLTMEANRVRRMTPRGRARSLLNAARVRAKKYGLSCTIDVPWIAARLEAGVCELTGIRFDFNPLPGSKINPFSPSLDRIDPKHGYTPDNVRVLVTAMNVALNANGVLIFEHIATAYLAKH